MRRIIILSILIILSFLLQTTIIGFNNLESFSPNLLLILTMSFGLMRGRKEGMLVGFFCGFLVDCFFTTVLGPYMFLFMIIGYTNGFFHKNYLVEDVLLPVIIICLDTLAFNTIVYIVFFMMRNRLNFSIYLFKIILPEMFFTALITLALYKIYVVINKRLKQIAKGNE